MNQRPRITAHSAMAKTAFLDAFQNAGVTIYCESECQGVFDDDGCLVSSSNNEDIDMNDDVSVPSLNAHPQCILDQIAAETMGQLWAQSCQHAFSVLLLPERARLLRWDRAGVIISEDFSWKDGDMFSAFLWRYKHLSRAQKGHDTSARPASAEEEALATSEMRENGYDEISKALFFFTYTIVDNTPTDFPSRESRSQDFVAARPLVYHCSTPAGRSTFVYAAYDLRRKRLVYLKHTWWQSGRDITVEGGTYRQLLNESTGGGRVPHIPNIQCTGNVYDDNSVNGAPQRTVTGYYADEEWVRSNAEDIAYYTHSRLVLDETALPLEEFSSTKEIARALLDIFIGP
jgi:hypothetical protein